MRIYHIFAVTLILVICTGCSENRGLHGEWKFDGKFTKSKLPEEATSDSSGLHSTMDGLKTNLSVLLIEKFEGSGLRFTSDEIISISADGSSEAESYEVIDRPTDDSWRIKTSDGRIETWYREGERLAVNTRGFVFRAYFTQTED